MLQIVGDKQCHLWLGWISSKEVKSMSNKNSSKSGAQKSSGTKNTGGHYRSAITGRYVTSEYGKANPKTTVREK